MQIDMDYRNHLQAFLNFTVKAKKKAGKNKEVPVYNRFEKFYNYEKEVEKVQNAGKEKSHFARLKKFLSKKGE